MSYQEQVETGPASGISTASTAVDAVSFSNRYVYWHIIKASIQIARTGRRTLPLTTLLCIKINPTNSYHRRGGRGSPLSQIPPPPSPPTHTYTIIPSRIGKSRRVLNMVTQYRRTHWLYVLLASGFIYHVSCPLYSTINPEFLFPFQAVSSLIPD